MADRRISVRLRTCIVATLAGVVLGLLAAHALGEPQSDDTLETARQMFVRPTLVPFPVDNSYSGAKADLGRRLFFDPRLSGGGTMSCATCHMPDRGFEDGRKIARGERGQDAGRHTPTLWNVAWGETFLWDGRAASLEDQALAPIANPLEMDRDLDALIRELSADADYARRFSEAFPDEPWVSARNLARAIATFERTLVSPETPFDHWVAGDETAISAAAKRGLALFTGKANCAGCHAGWNFTDNAFHDIGLPTDDPGRGAVLAVEELRHAFKTPTLREIGRRAPYMHDGSLSTLDDVLDHYERGIIARPSLSPDLRSIALTPAERADLIAFLATLNSHDPTMPDAPRRTVDPSPSATQARAAIWRAEVTQKDKRFSTDQIVLHSGGTLLIRNDDTRVHNIRIFHPRLDYNSGIQHPGEAVSIVFDAAGLYQAFCGIHPSMKLMVEVR